VKPKPKDARWRFRNRAERRRRHVRRCPRCRKLRRTHRRDGRDRDGARVCWVCAKELAEQL